MALAAMPPRLLAGARGRLMMFNLLVVAVTLMVSSVAIMGFHHAGTIQEQAQERTLDDMTGSLALARDTANVATAAVRLSQVIGALEYRSEADRLKQTQRALQHSLSVIAVSPLARSEPELVRLITERSLTLERSIGHLLTLSHIRHLQRNQLLSALYQCQLTLAHIDLMMRRQGVNQPSVGLRREIDQLLTIAIDTPSPHAVMFQLDRVMGEWPTLASPGGVLGAKIQQFRAGQRRLTPIAQALDNSDLAIAFYTYQIKALVAMLNLDITRYVAKVAQTTEHRTEATHRELNSVIAFIGLFALIALVITGFAGLYIYRNLGSNLTTIANAMTRLASGEREVSVPALTRRDELGDLARAFNVFARNTASLEQTSRLLREKSTQLETTFIAMRDGFALFDREGKLVVWNPQYPLLLGLTGESLQRGQQDSTLLKSVSHQDAAWLGELRWEEALTDLRRALPQPQELRLADGRVIELRFSPVPGHGMVNTVLERTERRALEEALVHSQKMKAVGQLTGGLAHDFNNLLAVIIGSLELTGGYAADAAAGRRIARALKAAERAAQLTQRLLAFSRKQSLSPRAVDVAALVESLHELMTHSLLPGQSLVIDAQPGLWYAWIDPSQLENALLNLVVNARDAMQGRDGDIQLRIVNQRVARSSGKQQEMVTLEVIDQGCGMPPDVRAQVFEPFFTTKAVGSGSGLGLSMVYGFIRQSGGKVQLDTAPGQGTRVQLQLPRAPAQAPALPVVASSEVERLVLVLEDEEDVRQTLCEHLHQLGYLTIQCADGEQALSLLRQTPEINMLLSDLMLPGALNGVDVIRLAMQQHPALAVLLVSGQDLRHRVDGALPFCERLAKLFSQQQLAQALRRAWQRSVTTRRRNG